MNGQKNPMAAPPAFDKMVWRCPCCSQDRTDKFIKVCSHDVGVLFGHDTGSMFVNVKYCADMPGCKEKAFNRGWVIDHFFKKFMTDANIKIDLQNP